MRALRLTVACMCLGLALQGCNSRTAATPSLGASTLATSGPGELSTANRSAGTADVSASPRRSSARKTVSPQRRATVAKILVFIEENHSLSEMRAQMPYLYRQSKTYSYATSYTAIRHPSLPDYLAIAGGSTYAVADDSGPSAHPIDGRSVFGAAITAGRSAKSYQESMTSNCQLTNSDGYAVKHNPWAYFTRERALCQANDVPSGTPNSGALHNDIVSGALPNVAEVTPNLAHDAHDGSLATADAWLKDWLTLIYGSPDWTAGRLAVIVLADEDDFSEGNKVMFTVIHPSQSHHIVSAPLSHYSLTGLLTRVTHAPCINEGCSAPNLAAAFALPLS
jgi:hypothetical protein